MTESVTAGYAGPRGKQKMWVNVLPYPLFSRGVPFSGEMELGRATRRVDWTSTKAPRYRSSQFTLPVPASDRPTGHFIVSDSLAAARAEAAFGAPVGSLPSLADRVLPPAERRSRRSVLRAARAKDDCGSEDWEPGRHPEATVRAQLDSWPGRPSRLKLSEQPDGDWSVTAEGARPTFDFWRVSKGCWVLGRIQPGGGTERVESVSVTDNRFVFDIQWGGAEEAFLEFGFGSQETRAMVRRIAGPIVVMDDDWPPGVRLGRKRPGHYQVVFYKDGWVVNAEGGALPPLGEWS
jgi:hypothetical protein